MKKALSTIHNEIALARSGFKVSQSGSYKKVGSNSQIHQSRRAMSAVSDSKSNSTHQVQSHPGVDISYLIVKSLIDFG